MIHFFFASKFALFATVFHFFATPPYIFATPPSFSPLNDTPRAFFTPKRHKPFGLLPDSTQHTTSPPAPPGPTRPHQAPPPTPPRPLRDRPAPGLRQLHVPEE